jgi:hypothetical protein
MSQPLENSPSLFGLIPCARTSAYGDKPCEEAEELECVRVDRRTVDDPMKNPYIGKSWYKSGRNHRVENGRIARDFDDTQWVVRISDALELQSFCQKYSPVIISIDDSGPSPRFSIEIYDDYRE